MVILFIDVVHRSFSRALGPPGGPPGGPLLDHKIEESAARRHRRARGTAARDTGAAAAGWDDAGGVALRATRDLENQLGQLWNRGTRPRCSIESRFFSSTPKDE
jgi:hypothetical protein